jgi:hypothetical protein
LIQLIEARKDAPKMLDFIDEAFNQMAFTIQPAIIFTQDLGALVRRDYGFNTTLQQVSNEMGCGVATISDQSLKIKSFQQMLSLSNVMMLTGRQSEAERVAQTIYQHMNFGREAA